MPDRLGDYRMANRIEGTMTDVVARARAALEGVTEGDWKAYRAAFVSSASGPVCWISNRNEDGGDVPAFTDAEFIAAARSLVPELIAEVERLRQQRTITTVEQLDALPVGAVVHPGGCVYEKVTTEDGDDEWWTDGQHDPNFDQRDLPATLLWLPEWGNA